MTPVRLGAVDYLNARPLVRGLDRQPERFTLRFDVPSECARLLHTRGLDVGMIPSIEYLRQPGYRIVPDVSIASKGPVASVALYASRPVGQLRSIAADSSSRTSAALLRVLCARHFGIDPTFVTRPPDVEVMLAECDAALLIGDAALFLDHESKGLDKHDLGTAWTAMTGLPFVWAFWAGRDGVLGQADVRALQQARDDGVAAADAVAEEYCDPARAMVGRRYLRENVRYGLDREERSGLERFYACARELGLVERSGPVLLY